MSRADQEDPTAKGSLDSQRSMPRGLRSRWPWHLTKSLESQFRRPRRALDRGPCYGNSDESKLEVPTASTSKVPSQKRTPLCCGSKLMSGSRPRTDLRLSGPSVHQYKQSKLGDDPPVRARRRRKEADNVVPLVGRARGAETDLVHSPRIRICHQDVQLLSCDTKCVTRCKRGIDVSFQPGRRFAQVFASKREVISQAVEIARDRISLRPRTDATENRCDDYDSATRHPVLPNATPQQPRAVDVCGFHRRSPD